MKVLNVGHCYIFAICTIISVQLPLGNFTPTPGSLAITTYNIEDDSLIWNKTEKNGEAHSEHGIQESLNNTADSNTALILVTDKFELERGKRNSDEDTTERYVPTKYLAGHTDSNSTSSSVLTTTLKEVNSKVENLRRGKMSSENDLALETSTYNWAQNITELNQPENHSIYNDSDFGNGTVKSSIPYGQIIGFYADIPNEVLLVMQIGKRYVIPICMFCGTCFNFLSFLTMLHHNLLKKSYAVYLMTLAVFDTLIMWWDGFASWLWVAFEVKVKDLSSTCWAKTFGNSFFTTTAAWLIVAVTFERFLVVYFPIKSRSWITTSRARIITCILCVASAAIFSPLLFTYVSDGGASVYGNLASACKMREELRFYVVYFAGICWTLLYCVLPTTSLILLNAAIIIKLKQSNQKYKTEMNETETSKSRQSSTQHISRMVTVMSMTYIVCTFPVTVAFTYRQFNTERLSHREIFAWLFVEQIGQITAYLNHSINFFLYILSSNQFRSAFKDIILCRSRRNQLKNKRSTGRKTLSSERSTQSSNLSSKEPSQHIVKPSKNAMVNMAFKEDGEQSEKPA